MRGLVVSVPIEIIDGGGLYVRSSSLAPQELRSSILFWDKLDFPQSRLINFADTPDTQFLAESGILQRSMSPIFSLMGGRVGQAMHESQVAVFRELDKREPGSWSLAVGQKSIAFPDHDLESGRGVLVKLYGAIPVPDKEVPLQEILDFKQRRGAELQALRYHMDSVYQRLISAGDGALAWESEIDQLKSSIEDHIRVSRETKFKFRLFDLSASLNLVPVAAAVLSRNYLHISLGESVVTGVAAGIAINISSGLKNRKSSKTPFNYVSSYHKELF